MQAAPITLLPMAGNGADMPADAVSSGHGQKMSSALQSQTTDRLFTKILQEGIALGVPLNKALNLRLGDISAAECAGQVEETKQDESVDVCALLMQLMVMNPSMQSAGGNGNSAGKDENAISVTAGAGLSGLENAVTEILRNGGAQVLSALTASESAGTGDIGNTNGDADSVQLNELFDHITGALKNELKQSGGADNAQVTGSGEAAAGNKTATDVTDGVFPKIGESEKRAVAASPDSGNFKEAGLPEGLLHASSASADGTGNEAAGDGRDGDFGFGAISSREKSKNNEIGAAENYAGPAPAQTGIENEATLHKTSAVERALNRFTDDLRSLRGGSHEIKIILEPESLGVLTISVVKTESGISAKIKSDDKEVAAIISDQIQKLVTSMQSKGITVNDVDVVYSQTDQNTSFAQQNFSQARDESRGGYAMPSERGADGDAPDADVWQSYYVGDTGSDTTVDYRV